jgi:flavodoxin
MEKLAATMLLALKMIVMSGTRCYGEETNVLVAYFSCTGNTRSMAEHVANVLNVTLYEIKPEIPYTTADLNWRDNSSRASLEKNDPSSRPAISGAVENMEKYGIVFLAYPIWWGQAPQIVYTFLDSYDFSGKTIIPFCTSGSSGIGSSATNLHGLCADSTKWFSGARLPSGASRNGVVKWINGLGLDIIAE